MIKAEVIYKDKGKGDLKFDHFKVTVGDRVYEPVPIFMLRISELKTLEAMLVHAATIGAAEATVTLRDEEQRRGIERYNRANEGLLAVENFGKWGH